MAKPAALHPDTCNRASILAFIEGSYGDDHQHDGLGMKS